ncbi:hypothetical protein RhiirC2_714729 [Rhizophagus irregularis]|uniref:Uncharacterized protein n=1 Tax=Rhizophagus irregularis TaxID=588596 RepID=A0A2N1MY98_9GLOM|nr:hypothetical protein RhiirC2_714729 [Rhizophagus irregularis]
MAQKNDKDWYGRLGLLIMIGLGRSNFELEQDNQFIRLKIATEIKEFAEKENILQLRIAQLQNEKQALTGNLTEQLEQNKLTKQQGQVQISQLEQEKIDLEEKLTQTKANIQELKFQQENLIEQKEQLENKLSQFQFNYEQTEQEKIKLHKMLENLSNEQKNTTKLKVKLKKEIAQLEQKLINEEQIKMQLTQALQIKEDRINELEQRSINLDYICIKKIKKELSEINKKLLNKLSSGKNTSDIHKEKGDKQKEMNEFFKQELSRTSASYNTNRRNWVLKQVNNFLKAKDDFLTLQEEAIKKLQDCCNHLESSINKERNTISFTRDMKIDMYIKEFQTILVNYNDGLLELNKKFSFLKKIVQENKEVEVSLTIRNIFKLNSYNFNKYKIIKFATNSQKGTGTQLNSNMMTENINSLRKNLDELKLELNQEKEELKNLAAVYIQPY